MVILVIFAFLAGIATILAPCILPILPIVLSAGVTGGKRRPLGIVAGLVVSFTFFTLALSLLVKHLGIGPDFLRTTAIVILLAFGVIMLVPKLLLLFESAVSRLIPQAKGGGERTDFWGGVLVGISLGLVWTPCVGPIMASVIALAATSSVTIITVYITVAYVLGTSIPLLAIMYGGQQLIARTKGINRYTQRIQQVFGLIMIVTAVGMLAGLDLTIQNALLAKLPSDINAGITQKLEESSLVQTQLKNLKGQKGGDLPTSSQIIGGTSSGLPVLGDAPDFTGISHWINSDPLTISQLKGKVVLIDFWTYSCINCLRTLPHVTSWYNTYKDQGFVVIGVSAPEFEFEKDTGNVTKAMAQYGITYPVAQDNELATWNAYNNQYWPAEYLVDAEGRVRATDFGEGNYDEMDTNIRALLEEAKKTTSLPAQAPNVADQTPTEQLSPETYLGTDRQSGYRQSADPSSLATDEWTLKGDWQIGDQYITSGQPDDSLSYKFIGKDVYLVLNPPDGSSSTVQVLLDGKPIATQGGADVHDGLVTVDTDRLYHLAHVDDAGTPHLLTLIFQKPGVKAYSFTFG